MVSERVLIRYARALSTGFRTDLEEQVRDVDDEQQDRRAARDNLESVHGARVHAVETELMFRVELTDDRRNGREVRWGFQAPRVRLGAVVCGRNDESCFRHCTIARRSVPDTRLTGRGAVRRTDACEGHELRAASERGQ